MTCREALGLFFYPEKSLIFYTVLFFHFKSLPMQGNCTHTYKIRVYNEMLVQQRQSTKMTNIPPELIQYIKLLSEEIKVEYSPKLSKMAFSGLCLL